MLIELLYIIEIYKIEREEFQTFYLPFHMTYDLLSVLETPILIYQSLKNQPY